ncbi:MAG: haloacid dehalogenase type II [Dehalococcoidia bacterium]
MLEQVRALTFDVFGTVVDWRGSVIREGEALGRARGWDTDWASFADDWRRDGYIGGMRRVRDGELPWMTVDALHRRKLDSLLDERGLTGLDEDATAAFNRVWHRLDPWPDVPAGLARLRTRSVVSTLSNGNVSLLIDLARHGGLTWDCVLSAEITGAFKPEPRCYERAAELLSLAPAQVLMVAAHPSDLRAAAAVGFHTAYLRRPLEWGPAGTTGKDAGTEFDLVEDSLVAIAGRLGG